MALIFLFSILITSHVTAQSESNQAEDIHDYDVNGRRVTYYPDTLMISHNPQAVVFYHNTKLFNPLFVDLRTPHIGHDFAVNDTCDSEQSQFLKSLMLQLRADGFTSLIECDSYIRRFYQYSTGLTATMTCPYGYRKSLMLCKLWALQHYSHISPHERTWLQPSRPANRSVPWACTAGLTGIRRVLGGSCDSNDIGGLKVVLAETIHSMNTLSNMVRTANGKTIYLAKFTDKLTSKVAGLTSALRVVDETFGIWASKLRDFPSSEDCHFNIFMELLSKFSLEVTSGTLLRLIGIYDVLHQSHQLHKKELVGFDSLPSFLSTAIQNRLTKIPPSTASALDAGFPLLLNPMLDYQYQLSKSVGINILFTIPELAGGSTFCTLEYLLPIKYNLSGICYQRPIARDHLARLRCEHSEFLLHAGLLHKCYHSDSTCVYPQHMLQLVNDTSWLGLPWTATTKLTFSRHHQKAPNCANLHDLHHLGRRQYLTTQQGVLTIHNTTNGSFHTIPLSPLIVYNFPCDVKFSTQQTGFGSYPDRIKLKVPLFTAENYSDLLHLHYKSLNISPSLQFDNSTLQSLDNTFHHLDGQLHSLQQDISKLHFVRETNTNDLFTYFAFVLALIKAIIIVTFKFCSVLVF